MVRAFVFPGQGSQTVGMGRDLAEAFAAAREVFDEVDDALSQRLSRLMFEGPEDQLTLTENAQPAIMATSMAVVRVLEREAGLDMCKAALRVAGHSLGEYSALAAAGTFPLGVAARLLKARGRAMQEAVKPGEGAMAAILGLDLDAVRAVAEEAAGDEVCQPANDNGGDQVVVSGHAAAVDRAIVLAGERGAKRAIRLTVSAPFHCALMQPAADAMAQELAAIDLAEPAVPLVANVTASAVLDTEEIGRLLVRQVTSMVRWRESVQAMRADGVDTIVELGAGKVLSGLARRIDRDLQASSVGTPLDIEAFVKIL